jgi:hypothetical protein
MHNQISNTFTIETGVSLSPGSGVFIPQSFRWIYISKLNNLSKGEFRDVFRCIQQPEEMFFSENFIAIHLCMAPKREWGTYISYIGFLFLIKSFGTNDLGLK